MRNDVNLTTNNQTIQNVTPSNEGNHFVAFYDNNNLTDYENHIMSFLYNRDNVSVYYGKNGIGKKCFFSKEYGAFYVVASIKELRKQIKHLRKDKAVPISKPTITKIMNRLKKLHLIYVVPSEHHNKIILLGAQKSTNAILRSHGKQPLPYFTYDSLDAIHLQYKNRYIKDIAKQTEPNM